MLGGPGGDVAAVTPEGTPPTARFCWATGLWPVAPRIGCCAGDTGGLTSCSIRELVARLHVVLRRQHGPAEAFLTAGDLRLDLMSRRAFRGTVALDLAPREFDLLELLVRHADIVVTRQTILIALWGRDAAVSKNVVDQYMAHLRKKVDRPFGRCDLETVYGVGWRLRVPEAR